MAIGADAAVNFYNADTTELEETGGSASVADNAVSAFDTTDLDLYTHSDDSPLIIAWLQMNSAGTPAIGSGVLLIGQIMNATGVPSGVDTNDSPTPTTDYLSITLGRWPVKNVTTEQFIPMEVYLPDTEPGTVWQLGIFVDAHGASVDAGWGVHVRAKTTGPHA